MIVVDTNIIAACCEINENKKIAHQLRAKNREWHAPLLWIYEFRNLLVNFQRRGLISKEHLTNLIFQARELVPAGRTHSIGDKRVLDLAMQSSCTAYDCEFVAVAEALGVPLLTWDKQLLKQFPKIAVNPEQYLTINT